MQSLDHITFRPGDLAERLSRGPLSPGGTAKRDLLRHYTLIDTVFDQWATGWTMTGEAWEVVVDFCATRGWDTVPYPEVLLEQFKQFLTSPLGLRHDRVSRSMAATALLNADYPQVVAIVSYAEIGSGHPTFSRSPGSPEQQDGPTAGATSAASPVASGRLVE